MKNFKKVICLLLTVVLMFSMAACGGDKDEKGVTLKWFIPGSAQTDHASVLAEVNKIVESKLGVKLDLQFIDLGAFGERMKMNMASQTEFDIMWVGYANNYESAVENGGIIGLEEMLKNTTPDLKASIPDYFWEAARYGDDIYAVPCVQIAAQNYAFCIKKDLVEKYNIDVTAIKTVDDIEPVLQLIKEKEPDLFPFQPKYGPKLWTFEDYQNLDETFLAVRKDDSKGKVVNLMETKEFQKGIKKMREWYEKGYIRADVASATDDTLDLNEGRYGVHIQVMKPGLEATFKNTKGYEIVAVPFTTPFFDGKGALQTMNAISSTSKHPEKALQLLELVNTDKELHNLLSFGIKDKHYKINENGKAEYINDSGWQPKADWKFGNQFNSLILEGQNDDVWEQTIAMNENAVKSKLLGFTFLTTNITRELSNVTSVVSEYNAGMLKGYNDPKNYLSEYKEKLKTAGLDKMVEEAQKQVNEFLKNK